VDPRGVSGGAPNPLVGQRWFVDPREPAWQSYVSYARHGRRDLAELMWRVAREPRFRWFGRWTGPDVAAKVRSYLGCAGALQPGSVPLMVVMHHQGKRCSPTYAAGGDAEDARTREWYDRFAQGVGNARVVIGFEPDSLGTLECLARHRRRARLDVLRYGVERLSQLPNATIYLEAGASDWEPAARTARQLRYIGIERVRGFMLNVTHHDWTRANIRHGVRISRMVGGKPFIVNTSYNGRGPLHFRRGHRRVNIWCNPPWARPRPPPDDLDGPPPGGRLHVDQPARLLGRLLQRRAAPRRSVVAGARPDVRPESDLVARPAPWNGARALPSLGRNLRAAEDPSGELRIVRRRSGNHSTVWGGTQAGNS
jgi:endoglucanase